MTLNYNIIEHPSMVIIYYYKVGSRFLDAYFSEYNTFHSPDFKRHFINIFDDDYKDGLVRIGKYYMESHIIENSDILKKIINKESINKPILLIYRNPYEKTLSGICEDFHEEFMRGDDSVHYIDTELFYEYIKNNTYTKKHLDILNQLCNGLNTMQTFEFLQESYSSERWYMNLLKKYLEYRISIKQIGKYGHTEIHTFNTFTILQELLQNQECLLINLDDESVSLKNILDSYFKHKKKAQINKTDFSNKGFKSKLEGELSLRTKQALNEILQDELHFYNILNNLTHPQK